MDLDNMAYFEEVVNMRVNVKNYVHLTYPLRIESYYSRILGVTHWFIVDLHGRRVGPMLRERRAYDVKKAIETVKSVWDMKGTARAFRKHDVLLRRLENDR